MTSFLTREKSETELFTRPWMPAAAPLMTRWAMDVTPDKVRPEYPRPSAVRAQWSNLNGLWEFSIDSDDNYGDKILVPYTFEAALSGIGKGKEVHERVAYRRTFRVPRTWKGKRVLLHFGAVDWEARVVVNGHEIGRHRGGYAPFSFDITNALNPQGEQELVVEVHDPAAFDPHAFGMIPKQQKAFQPMGKQLGSVGIWYTRSTGIWQTVWLEPVSETYISDFRLHADLETGKVQLTADVQGPVSGQVTIRILKDGELVATGKTDVTGRKVELEVVVRSPRAWSPESPELYDVSIALKGERKFLDQINTYCAFRTICVHGDRITLNGKPYLLRGVLDQGYWPDGVYTPPTLEAIQHDLTMAKAMGFNLMRKHAKIEEDVWYTMCDRMGLLVAQDMPSSQDLSRPEAKANYLNEWSEVVTALRNHPSIVLWIPFNENWGNPGEFQDHVADYTRELDGTRLIIDASGWTQRTQTDIIDHHDYTNDLAQYARAKPGKPQWFGEYGGVALPVEGHTWMKWWGYQSVKSPNKYLQKVKFLTKQITSCPIFSGFCFTQLTDVEQEMNGLLTYDRIPKAPLESYAEIFTAGG